MNIGGFLGRISHSFSYYFGINIKGYEILRRASYLKLPYGRMKRMLNDTVILLLLSLVLTLPMLFLLDWSLVDIVIIVPMAIMFVIYICAVKGIVTYINEYIFISRAKRYFNESYDYETLSQVFKKCLPDYRLIHLLLMSPNAKKVFPILQTLKDRELINEITVKNVLIYTNGYTLTGHPSIVFISEKFIFVEPIIIRKPYLIRKNKVEQVKKVTVKKMNYQGEAIEVKYRFNRNKSKTLCLMAINIGDWYEYLSRL